MQIDRKLIEASLKKKGFVEEGGDHRYFLHQHGKRTGVTTFTSHGSGYKTYGITLLKRMRIQLRLDSMLQTRRLLECPMDADEYNAVLKEKGIF